MSDRKEYFKKYRLEHKEKYKEYQRKYRGTHLSTYERLQKENQELKKKQKEFIRWLEKEIVDSKTAGSQRYYTMQHLRLFKEIIGDKE